MLYSEMLRHGYTNVAEFHYLHHSQNGTSYDNVAELGSRLINAAKETGIGITLIPIFYQKTGCETLEIILNLDLTQNTDIVEFIQSISMLTV